MFGAERTTVTVTARALQAAALIKYSRGRVTILDRGGLEERSRHRSLSVEIRQISLGRTT